jgi:hypothetical protein
LLPRALLAELPGQIADFCRAHGFDPYG